MKVQLLSELVTKKAPRSTKTPWLSGRGPRRELVYDFVLVIDDVLWCVPAGYVFDGSSIPWFLWWLFPPGYDPAWEAAAFHDRCYSHWYEDHINAGEFREGVTKQFADDAFHAIMRYSGAKPWIARAFHRSVSWFGRGGW